jgi:hypothetical protein
MWAWRRACNTCALTGSLRKRDGAIPATSPANCTPDWAGPPGDRSQQRHQTTTSARATTTMDARKARRRLPKWTGRADISHTGAQTNKHAGQQLLPPATGLTSRSALTIGILLPLAAPRRRRRQRRKRAGLSPELGRPPAFTGDVARPHCVASSRLVSSLRLCVSLVVAVAMHVCASVCVSMRK